MNVSPTGNANMPRPFSSVATAWKANDQFPAGLRVLAVDDNHSTLETLERMLRQCNYEVTKCYRAETALSLLRENENGFDLVLSDVHLPDMDGFQLLEHIGLEVDLPVIMMSEDEDTDAVMKGVTHGACDHLLKPVSIQALKNIWQHVVRKKSREWKDLEQLGSVEDGDQQAKHSEVAENTSSANNECSVWKNNLKKRKDEEDESEEKDETSALKKPRVVWSVELHQQFVVAVNQLGIDKAVPKKILELMNVPGLSRENVASHLQKYRLYLRRISRTSLQNEVSRALDGTLGSLSSFNGLDLEANAISSHLRVQSPDSCQAECFGATTKSSLPTQSLDHQNLFSLGNSKLHLEKHLQPHLSKSSCKDENLLSRIPETVHAEQLPDIIHSAEPFGATNMQVSSHGILKNSLLTPQSSGLVLNGHSTRHASLLRSSVRLSDVTNEIIGTVHVRNGIFKYEQAERFNSVAQESSMVNFHMDHNTELTSNTLPLWNTPGLSHDDVDSEIMVSRYVPSYVTLNELNQPKSQDWELRHVETFGSPHPTLQLDVLPSFIVQQQGFCNPKVEQNSNMCLVGKTIYSSGEENQHLSAQNMSQHLYPLVGINDPNCGNSLRPECYVQPDVMSTILQQQEGAVDLDGAFNFDEDPVGNSRV